MGRINIIIEEELHKKLKVACALESTTIEKYINEALTDKLRKGKHVK